MHQHRHAVGDPNSEPRRVVRPPRPSRRVGEIERHHRLQRLQIDRQGVRGPEAEGRGVDHQVVSRAQVAGSREHAQARRRRPGQLLGEALGADERSVQQVQPLDAIHDARGGYRPRRAPRPEQEDAGAVQRQIQLADRRPKPVHVRVVSPQPAGVILPEAVAGPRGLDRRRPSLDDPRRSFLVWKRHVAAAARRQLAQCALELRSVYPAGHVLRVDAKLSKGGAVNGGRDGVGNRVTQQSEDGPTDPRRWPHGASSPSKKPRIASSRSS